MTEDPLAAAHSFFRVNSVLSALQERLGRYQRASLVLREATAALQAVHTLQPLLTPDPSPWGDILIQDEQEQEEEEEEDVPLFPFATTAEEEEEEAALVREWLAALSAGYGGQPDRTAVTASLLNLSSLTAALAWTRVRAIHRADDVCARVASCQQKISALQADVKRAMERVDWVFNCLPAALELEVACVRWLHNLVQWHCPRDGNSTPAASVVPSDVADALLSTEDPTGSAKSFWDQLEQSHRMIWATVQETSFWATERQLYRHRLQQQRVRMLNACERALANFSGRL